MRNLIILLVVIFTTQAIIARDVHVKGYTRSNGTDVQPHIRSTPDNVK